MLTSNPGTPPQPQNHACIHLAFMCPWTPKNPLIYSSYHLIVSGLSLHMISWKLKFPQIKTTASYILINESVYLQEENRNNRKWKGTERERGRGRERLGCAEMSVFMWPVCDDETWQQWRQCARGHVLGDELIHNNLTPPSLYKCPHTRAQNTHSCTHAFLTKTPSPYSIQRPTSGVRERRDSDWPGLACPQQTFGESSCNA